jgi:hypothetical protein
MSKLFFFIAPFFVINVSINAFSVQKCVNKSNTETDPLSISFKDFQDKLSYYLDMMKGEEVFTEEEYIEMVLVDNTLFVMMSTTDPRYKVNVHKDFLDFLKEYMDDILDVLKADKQGCNGGFYSSKHDLCISGTAPNKHSIYQIID